MFAPFREAAERELKAEERAKVQSTGKTPFFHSRGHVRKLVVQRRKEGKKSGRDKQAERQERKAAAKGKKRLPAKRREAVE